MAGFQQPGVTERHAVGRADLDEIPAPLLAGGPQRPQVLEQLGLRLGRARQGEGDEPPGVLRIGGSGAQVLERALQQLPRRGDRRIQAFLPRVCA